MPWDNIGMLGSTESIHYDVTTLLLFFFFFFNTLSGCFFVAFLFIEMPVNLNLYFEAR